MSAGPVEQILFRTPIAAVNNGNDLRVYTVDVFGNIRESLSNNGPWINGTIKNVIVKGKLGTPIAATSKALDEIRVYYISNDNLLREQCYTAGKGWYEGALNASKFQVAPYSKVAGAFLPTKGALEVRVYAQIADNTIQEFCWDGSHWSKMTNLGAALPGTEIATTSFFTTELFIRTYFQLPNLDLIEKGYQSKTGWFNGGFLVPVAPPRASLGCTSVSASTSGFFQIRVYVGVAGDRIIEKCWDNPGPWYTGGFNQPCIAGSEVAAIGNNTKSDWLLKVFLQNGTVVTGVSEFVWDNKTSAWKLGTAAISPA